MDNIEDGAVFHVSDPCTSQPLIEVREAAKRAREARDALCSALTEIHRSDDRIVQSLPLYSCEDLLKLADLATKPYRVGTYKKADLLRLVVE